MSSGNEREHANSRMTYEINIADIREFKARQWHVTYLAFLLLGAVVTTAKYLPDWASFLLLLFLAITSIPMLWKFHCEIANRRKNLNPEDKERWRDAWVPILLSAYILIGAVVSAYVACKTSPPPRGEVEKSEPWRHDFSGGGRLQHLSFP